MDFENEYRFKFSGCIIPSALKSNSAALQLEQLKQLQKDAQKRVKKISKKLDHQEKLVDFFSTCIDQLSVSNNTYEDLAESDTDTTIGEYLTEGDNTVENQMYEELPKDNDNDNEAHTYVSVSDVIRRKKSGRKKKAPVVSVHNCFSQHEDQSEQALTFVKSMTVPSDMKFSVMDPVYEDIIKTISVLGEETNSAWHKSNSQRADLMRTVLLEEQNHGQILKVLVQYKQAAITNKKIPTDLVQNLFYNLDGLSNDLEMFTATLESRLEEIGGDAGIADLYLAIIESGALHGYLNNLSTARQALATLEDCAEFREMFSSGDKRLFLPVMRADGGGKEDLNLADAVFLPTKWLMTHAENCKVLLEVTPEDHEDRVRFTTFLSSLKNLFQEMTSSRELIKQELVVELNGNTRKLRRLFLFSDVLVCTKQTVSGDQNLELRWFIPRHLFVLYNHPKMGSDFDNKRKELVQTLKSRIKTLQPEVTRLKQEDGGLFRARRLDRCLDQLRKLQAQLVVAVPSLPLNVGRAQDKRYTFLFSSEADRTEWTELLTKHLHTGDGQPPTVSQITSLIQSYSYLARNVSDLGFHFMRKQDNEEPGADLVGNLRVIIHKVEGLSDLLPVGVALELQDTGGLFYRMNATAFSEPSREPVFEKEFELQLSGFESTIRFMVTQLDGRRSVDLGHLDLRLYEASLKSYFSKCHYLKTSGSPLLLTLSLEFTPQCYGLLREGSRQTHVMFGVPLDRLVRKELGLRLAIKNVPLLVQTLTVEIEKQGLKELGIYRISGSSLELQQVKAAFDKNPTAAARLVPKHDVHVLTGLLKLFLRELPEPLITVKLYSPLMQAMACDDESAKDLQMIALLQGIVEPNRTTLAHIFAHIMRISACSDENKMTLSNMGIIFGPTLLCPPLTSISNEPLAEGMQSIRQGGLCLRLLNLYKANQILQDL